MFTLTFDSSFFVDLAKCALDSLIKVNGGGVSSPKEKKTRNTQCVKLTKGHHHVAAMVGFWSCERINLLIKHGVSQERVDRVIKQDEKFVALLEEALREQALKQPSYDSWLFFDTDVKNTDFFELQECEKGSLATQSSIVITK